MILLIYSDDGEVFDLLSQSIDDVVKSQAVQFADQIKQAGQFAEKEEEIRIEIERALAVIQREVGITLQGRHEFTIGTGRIDSVYGCVIIEYKNPNDPSSRLSSDRDAKGNQEVVKQIKNRFYEFRKEENRPLNTMFGVGCDGNYFIFIRYRDDKWYVEDPIEVSKYSAERFLWALINMGTKGKAFSPEYLAGDFGSGSPLAQAGVRALYETICTTINPKAQVFFQQWKILFSEVCGYDVNTPSDKIKKLSESYGILSVYKPAELLFSLQAYYAIFMKLLSAEIVAFFHQIPTPIQKILKAPTQNKLKEEIKDLERGSIFRHLNITNFLEGDLFSWYLDAWNVSIEKLIRDMANKLDSYNPGTLSEDPTESRDLLKKLYQQLFPKTVRHDLGEYYTPDWLAEHVLNELKYIGNPDKRLLDPACGSGTFLVMAINKIRKWYDHNRETCGYDEGDLARKILNNVVGFDLNPLAVMAARTNYLIAIRDLIGRVGKVEIPVYLCDSIMTPSEYGGLERWTTGKDLQMKELKTSVAKFKIPVEVASDRRRIALYTEQLEFCIKNGYQVNEFIQRCRDEGLLITTEEIHIGLYNEFLKLDRASKNGVWARIIKNAFAPLFCGKFDYVAGNPPWIRWGYLPEDYREQTKDIWKNYGLFTQKGLRSRMGTAELDISILFTYACIDHYLPKNGKLGFLITQEVVKSKGAGEGFRRFQLGNRDYFKADKFHDMVDLKPFEAANKTALIITIKGLKTIYPVKYILWRKKENAPRIDMSTSLNEVISYTEQIEMQAEPIKGETGPWITRLSRNVIALDKLRTKASLFKGRIGARIEPYGVFLSRIHQINSAGEPVIENLPELGKKKIQKINPVAVESEFLYPIIRGKDVDRWLSMPIIYALIMNRSTKKKDLIQETKMRLDYPKTYAYMLNFQSSLLKRENFWKFFGRLENFGQKLTGEKSYYYRLKKQTGNIFEYEVSDAPFYATFNIGPYTFSQFKVVWSRMTNRIGAAVVSHCDTQLGRKLVIPTDTTTLVPFENEDEAHYFCALLNSTPSCLFIKRFSSAGRGFGSPSILENLHIPEFNITNSSHTNLSILSKKCHDATAQGNTKRLLKLEAEVDKAAAKLWDITDNELRALQNTLKDINSTKRRARKKNDGL